MALSAVLGAVIGCVKGFTKVKSGAVELLLVGGIVILVSSKALSQMENNTVAAIIAIVLSIGLICLAMFLFKLFRTLLDKRMEYRKKISYYKQYDEIEDNTEKILSALGSEDKKAYKKLSKRKFRQSAGVWGVLNRVFGAFTLLIKGVVISGLVCALLLAGIDFIKPATEAGGFLTTFCGDLYENSVWLAFKSHIFDFFVLAILSVCIKGGFSNGLFSSLWSFAILGLAILGGVASFMLALKNPAFLSAAEKMTPSIQNAIPDMGKFLESAGLSFTTLAQLVLGLMVFILVLITVIIIGIVVPKLIDGARESKIFCVVDGVLGAIVLTGIVMALMLVVGALANSLHNNEFMAVFNAYFEKSGIATYFYDRNLLNAMGILNEFPIFGSWLK